MSKSKKKLMKEIDQLLEKINDLGTYYDELSSSGQECYEDLAKLVGTEEYKWYSNAFPNNPPEIEAELKKEGF